MCVCVCGRMAQHNVYTSRISMIEPIELCIKYYVAIRMLMYTYIHTDDARVHQM